MLQNNLISTLFSHNFVLSINTDKHNYGKDAIFIYMYMRNTNNYYGTRNVVLIFTMNNDQTQQV